LRTSAVVVQKGRQVTLESDLAPEPSGKTDGQVRWLIVEGATRAELTQLFGQLGVDGEFLAGHILGEQWVQWLEREDFSIVALPQATTWAGPGVWYHLVLLPGTLVTVHRDVIEDLEACLERGWIDRPGPEAVMGDSLRFLLEGLTLEETTEFGRIRLEVERHAAMLKQGHPDLTIEHLEDLMTRSHHMSVVYFELQRFCEVLDFSRSGLVEHIGDCAPFRQAARILAARREAVEQVQRRMEELQRQHIMDQQARSESRLRTLTILSAVFLPLTLISSIYGMNFANMPELDDAYAYPIVLGGMAVIALAMVFFFVVRGWFR
jgi:magnesium transporter